MKTKKGIILLPLIILATFIFFHFVTESFFDFDEIEHYNRNIKHEEISIEIDKANKNEETPRFLDIVINDDYPKKIDKNFEYFLIKNGFKKRILNESKHEEIDDIFSESTCLISEATACIPTFRDILIFKKNEKTIGIAKICFECGKFSILGTEKNVESFGQCGDYEKLESLLK